MRKMKLKGTFRQLTNYIIFERLSLMFNVKLLGPIISSKRCNPLSAF